MQAVADGHLRVDLMYRLNVFPIEMPPLRDRLSDVPLLASRFLRLIGEQEGKEKSFTQDALDQLSAYHWPGNVRELRNAVQRAYVMATGGTIDTQWLPHPAGWPKGRAPESTTEAAVSSAGVAPLPRSAEALPAEAPAPAPRDAVVIPLGISLAEAEQKLILATLEHYGRQKERTAAALGISLKTLYNRLKQYAADDLA
jgi:DNA-binding NtrC family response regulator